MSIDDSLSTERWSSVREHLTDGVSDRGILLIFSLNKMNMNVSRYIVIVKS